MATSVAPTPSTVQRYTLQFIETLSQKITSILAPDIMAHLKEIKQNNKFVRRTTAPVKLQYKLHSDMEKSWRNDDEEDIVRISPREEFSEKLNGQLNKLSESNFDTISGKIHAMISDKDNLEFSDCIIDLIFQKSITQHLYSALYAKLISMMETVYGTGFKTQLMQRIDHFYEDTISTTFNTSTSTYEEMCELNAKKEQLLGIFIFIGCLYNCNSVNKDLTLKYYHILIKLIDSEDSKDTLEKYIDCVCTLVKEIGKKLEGELGKEEFGKLCIAPMNTFRLNTKKFSFKARFKVMDILDLNKKGW